MKTVTTKSNGRWKLEDRRWGGAIVALLSAIFHLLSSAAVAGDIPLIWNYPAPPPDLGGFRLYSGRVGTTTTNVFSVPKTQLTYTVTTLPPATYWFYVTAITTNGIQSDPSNLVIASIPAAPGSLGIPAP
jgi:hypothetical protein